MTTAAKPQAIDLPTYPEHLMPATESVAFLPYHKGNDMTPFPDLNHPHQRGYNAAAATAIRF